MTSLLPPGVALPEADQSVRRIQNDDDQHQAQNELPRVRKLSGRIEADQFEHRSSSECTESMGAAAEDGDKHELARLGPVAKLRRGDLLDHRHQRAADATEQ